MTLAYAQKNATGTMAMAMIDAAIRETAMAAMETEATKTKRLLKMKKALVLTMMKQVAMKTRRIDAMVTAGAAEVVDGHAR